MRVVNSEDHFEAEMERAMSEAKSAFGDGSVFVEKFIVSPKHIEVQVMGDQHGNVVHLFERDCSVQRRHQKVIEEAPSAILSDDEREKIGQAAIDVATSCGYYNAGTVEFIMDLDKNFYFLEMNTRLQVEHPVTEQITGIDLVKEQINVAEGNRLSFTQEDLSISGHSIEVRVYAEDPSDNFAPSIGELQVYERPGGEGVRLDDGYRQGQEIPIYYDPMIAKLVTWGKDREEAIEHMLEAIASFKIHGVRTTLPFCEFVLQHEAFRTANFTTKFVEEHFSPDKLALIPDENAQLAALAAVAYHFEINVEKTRPIVPSGSSRWKLRKRD